MVGRFICRIRSANTEPLRGKEAGFDRAATRTAIFLIRHPGNWFVQRSHQPAQGTQPFPDFLQAIGDAEQAHSNPLLLFCSSRLAHRAGEHPQPAIVKLLVVPVENCLWIDAEHDMGVITHALIGISPALRRMNRSKQRRSQRENGFGPRSTHFGITHSLLPRPAETASASLPMMALMIEILATELIRAQRKARRTHRVTT